MKKIYLLLLMLVVAIGSVAAKGDKIPDYDIIGAGSGNEGMVLVKVFVYSKSSSDQDLKRAVVHGVVFRGCTGNNSGSKQPAMASSDAESSHAAFCKDFFADDGEGQNDASIIVGSYERVKTSKGYKNGAIVQSTREPYARLWKKPALCVR